MTDKQDDILITTYDENTIVPADNNDIYIRTNAYVGWIDFGVGIKMTVQKFPHRIHRFLQRVLLGWKYTND